MKKKKTKRFILYIAGSLAAAAIIVGIAAFPKPRLIFTDLKHSRSGRGTRRR